MKGYSAFPKARPGLNLKFSFSLTSCSSKTKEPSLFCFPIVVTYRIYGFMPFTRALARRGTQTVSFRGFFLNRVTDFISYDSNRDANCTDQILRLFFFSFSYSYSFSFFFFFFLYVSKY